MWPPGHHGGSTGRTDFVPYRGMPAIDQGEREKRMSVKAAEDGRGLNGGDVVYKGVHGRTEP